MFRTPIGLRQFLVLNLLFLSFIWASIYFLQRPLYVEGPQLQIYLAAKNVIAGGGLHLDYYDDYHQLMVERSRANQSMFWQDVYALDRDGQRIAKHCHLMIAATIPFLYVFGDIGILVLGALCYLGLQVPMYLLIREWVGREPTRLTALLLICGTPFILFATTISYDLLAATLILLGLYIGRRLPGVAGILIGLTLFMRPSNLFYALLIFSRRFFPSVLRSALGFSAAVCAFLFFNNLFWGGPLVTAHTRMPIYYSGAVEFSPMPTSFSLEVFLSRWWEKLFSLRVGFLTYDLAVLPLFAAPFIWRAIERRRDFIVLFGTAVIQLLLIFAYVGWPESSGGSRYLLPASGLLSVLAAVVLEWGWQKERC